MKERKGSLRWNTFLTKPKDLFIGAGGLQEFFVGCSTDILRLVPGLVEPKRVIDTSPFLYRENEL